MGNFGSQCINNYASCPGATALNSTWSAGSEDCRVACEGTTAALFYMYTTGISQESLVDNCQCLDGCSPMHDANQPSTSLYSLDLDITPCPDIAFESCASGFVCASNLGNPDWTEYSYDSLQACVNAAVKSASGVTYIYYDPVFNVCMGYATGNCNGFKIAPGYYESGVSQWLDPDSTCRCEEIGMSRYQVTAGVEHAQHGVKPGKWLRYTLTVNPLVGARMLPADVALTMTLPSNVEEIKASSLTRSQEPFVDTVSNTVTWSNFATMINNNKARAVKVSVVAKVVNDAPAYSTLKFTAALAGLSASICPVQIAEDTVQVRPGKNNN